jgi:hypothetical protein
MNILLADVALGDAATWASAAGSFAAVVVALGLAFRDSLRQRWRDRRWQAERVTAWIVGAVPSADPSTMLLRVDVGNASEQSVYQVIVSLVAVQGAWRRDAKEGGYEYRSFLWQVAPGRRSTQVSFAGHGMSLRFGVEVAFQDAAGNNWRRLADGKLQAIDTNPVEYYNLSRPVGWEDNTFAMVGPSDERS